LAVSLVVSMLTMPGTTGATWELVHDLLVAELRPERGLIPDAIVQVALAEISRIEAERAVPEYLAKGEVTRPERGKIPTAVPEAVVEGPTRPYTDRRSRESGERPVRGRQDAPCPDAAHAATGFVTS
jgi:hypothetical protein